MKTTIDELLGSKPGVATAERNPGIVKKMMKFYRKLCRQNHPVHLHIHIEQMIMESNNHINI